MKESFKSNLRKIITGGAIIGAGLSSKESDAQSGLIGKVKDIIKDKIEVVSSGIGERVNKEHKEYPQEQQENKKDSIIYNWGGDKVGFKYPFEKVYKSDENFYRTVAYGNMKGVGGGLQSLSEEQAKMNALFNILKTEMNIEGDIKIYKESYGSTQIKNDNKKIDLGPVKIIDKVTFKDTKTGVYTTVIAVEVEKNRIKTEKTPITEPIKNSDETFNEELSDSTNWQEVEVENPTEPPIGNKPEKQPEYNPSVKKSDYHATFEDFKNTQQAEFDNYKKGKESEFDKYKKSQEEEFKKFQEKK